MIPANPCQASQFNRLLDKVVGQYGRNRTERLHICDLEGAERIVGVEQDGIEERSFLGIARDYPHLIRIAGHDLGIGHRS